MVSMGDVVYRLKRVPPRRMPLVVGRYALRTARARARRWQIEHNRGELSDAALRRSLGTTTPDEAFKHFLQRFFTEPATARKTAQEIKARYPRLAQRTIARAEDALQHIVDLLCSGPVPLGDRIDWHRDFKTGIGWPRDALADDQDYLRLGEPCDVKMPWELSRAHHWVTIGRAYALEADPRYAREFVAQMDAWLDDNPWPYGVNWGRAMEVAVRAINWLWAAALFGDAPEFSREHKQRFLKAMLQHGRHILDNLEYADNNGNHYLSNGVGLVFLGTTLAGFAESAAWRRKGFEIVWGEILQQVHPDGVDFEQGIGYQGLVAEFWYSSVLLCERNGIAVPLHVRERLRAMFEFMLAYTRPDGTFPQIGDNDDGRLANLDDEPVGSHRRHLAVGGVMFGDLEMLRAAGDAVETAAWVCGAEGLARLAALRAVEARAGDMAAAGVTATEGIRAEPTSAEARSAETIRSGGKDTDVAAGEVTGNVAAGEVTGNVAAGEVTCVAHVVGGDGTQPHEDRHSARRSRAFPAGGVYVLRAPDVSMVVDAGEVGMRGIGGHGHADVLSFDLWAGGAEVLVDSGTYTYTADPSARNLMRSTAAHNALRIDGEDSSRLGGDRWLWLIENDAHPRDVSWESDAERDVFQGTHDGYRRLKEPVDHTRRIVFDKRTLHFVIEDIVTGSGEHLLELFFHPGVPFDAEDGGVRLRAPRKDMWLFPPANTTARQESGWISKGYGLREPATVLVYAVRGGVPLKLRTDLLLVDPGTSAAMARSLVGLD